jgi:hypothetical protein
MRPPVRATSRPAAWKTMLALAGIGLALSLAGAGLLVATGSGYARPAAPLSMADAESSYAACQDFLRAQLKATGPVTFAPIRMRTVRRYRDGRIYVRSHAETPNAAARPVDVRFTCTMRPLSGGRWDLEGLSVSTD